MRFLRSTQLACLVLGALLVLAPAAKADVLWDQSDYNLTENGFINSVESGEGPVIPWEVYAFSVNDVSTTERWHINQITSYYKADVPNWGANVVGGQLVIFPKVASEPNIGEGYSHLWWGTYVEMTATLVGDHYEVVASGLNVVLEPGEYWISILPDAGWTGATGPNSQMRSNTFIGDATPTHDTAWVFPIWTVSQPGVDAAIKIEGAVPHAPGISISPGLPGITTVPDVTATSELSVVNTAPLPAEDLVWSVADFFCPWLVSVSPMSGTIPQAGSEVLTLTVDTTGLSVGTYTCSFTIESNGVGQPSLVVNVTMSVEEDCNTNGTPDNEDINWGNSSDIDGNGVPDECEDCNNNGYPDYLELIENLTPDCNADGIPDDCNIADGMPDEDGNGIPDICDVAAVPGQPVVKYRLHTAVPNPFNPSTTIGFDLPRAAEVRLSIYDVTGRLVRTLVQESRDSGRHEVMWRGVDDAGQQVPSGIYLYRLEAGSYVEMHRMTLLK